MSEEELSESTCEAIKQFSALIPRIEKIFSKEQKFTKSDFMEVYTNVYQYFVLAPNSDIDERELVIRRFFEKLGEFFRNRVHGILAVGEDEKDDGGVLRFYVREWSEYQRKAKTLDQAYRRAYFRRYRENEYGEQCEDKEEPMIIYKQLAITSWRDHPFRTRVVEAILNLIERERNGHESPDIHLIKDVLNCFTEDADIHTDSGSYSDLLRRYLSERRSSVANDLSVYQDTFENQFLRDTEIFYARQRTEFLNVNSSPTEYIIFVERKLQIEERVQTYLPERTGEKSMSICHTELITKYSDSQSERSVERGMQHLSIQEEKSSSTT